MLTTIEEFRDHMADIIARAGPSLTAPSAEGIANLDRCRAEMASVLSAYNLFVHREIFEALFAAGSPVEASAAREMKVECICLVEEFRRFTSEWRFADVASAWPEYQALAHDLRSRIERHLERVIAIADPVLSSHQLARAA